MFHLEKTAIPKKELESRKNSVLEAMSSKGIEESIFTTPANVYYLTGIQLGGFTSQQALILKDNGDHLFVMRRIELNWRDHWSPLTWCTEWLPYTDEQSPADVIGAAAKSILSHRPSLFALELNRNSISYEAANRIIEIVEPESTTSSAPLIERLRSVKSPLEIMYMREAGKVTRIGIEAAADAFNEGATEAEAAGASFAAMCKAGSEFFGMNPWVSSGPKTAMAHLSWSQVVPKSGDVVPIYMSASVRRYQCPVERTYTIGEPATKVRNMLERLIETVEELLSSIRPGMTFHEADRLSRNLIEKSGYGEFYVNRLAYGIGIAFPPNWGESDVVQFKPNDYRVIEPGMTVHLVPCLHVPGIGFLNRSMPIVTTENGCEPLSTMPLRVEPLNPL